MTGRRQAGSSRSCAMREPMATTSAVRIRNLGLHEDHLIDEVFDGMSDWSRLLRFHSSVPRLPAGLRRNLAQVRAGERVGVVALAEGRAVGLGHWIRDSAAQRRADLSLSVADAYQRQGVGTAMAGWLTRSARDSGIDELSCWISTHNEAVVAMVTSLAGSDELAVDGELVLDVTALLERTRPARWRHVAPPRGVRRPQTAASY